MRERYQDVSYSRFLGANSAVAGLVGEAALQLNAIQGNLMPAENRGFTLGAALVALVSTTYAAENLKKQNEPKSQESEYTTGSKVKNIIRNVVYTTAGVGGAYVGYKTGVEVLPEVTFVAGTTAIAGSEIFYRKQKKKIISV